MNNSTPKKCKQCGKEIEGIRNSHAKYCIQCAAKRKNRFVPSEVVKRHPEASLLDTYIALEGRIRELEEKWETVEKWAKDRFSDVDNDNQSGKI